MSQTEFRASSLFSQQFLLFSSVVRAPSRRSISLFHQEGRTKLEKDTRSLITESHVDSKEHGLEGVETEPEAGTGFEITEVYVRTAGRHLAGITEDCQIQTGKGFPPVLRVKEQEVLVTKPEFTEAAQRFSPSDILLHIKRNRLAGAGITQ